MRHNYRPVLQSPGATSPAAHGRAATAGRSPTLQLASRPPPATRTQDSQRQNKRQDASSASPPQETAENTSPVTAEAGSPLTPKPETGQGADSCLPTSGRHGQALTALTARPLLEPRPRAPPAPPLSRDQSQSTQPHQQLSKLQASTPANGHAGPSRPQDRASLQGCPSAHSAPCASLLRSSFICSEDKPRAPERSRQPPQPQLCPPPRPAGRRPACPSPHEGHVLLPGTALCLLPLLAPRSPSCPSVQLDGGGLGRSPHLGRLRPPSWEEPPGPTHLPVPSLPVCCQQSSGRHRASAGTKEKPWGPMSCSLRGTAPS